MWIPAGNTGMEPGKTSFFQALGVPTKIARGTIEITSDLKLVETGTKVGASEATLLNLLNISPFTYGMGIDQVYDQGNTFPPSVLDITEEQLLKAFSTAITTIAALSLAINFPTLPSVIHSLVNSYKKVLAVAIETDFSWPEIDELKDRIANPDAYAAAAPAASTEAAAETKEAAKEESEEENSDDDDGGFGGLLFVPPSLDVKTNPLTCFLATKCYDILTTVFRDGQSCVGHSKGFTDFFFVHRPFAAQSSTLHSMDQNMVLQLQLCRTFVGNTPGTSMLLYQKVSRLFSINTTQHLPPPKMSMIIPMIKELFNPDIIDETHHTTT